MPSESEHHSSPDGDLVADLARDPGAALAAIQQRYSVALQRFAANLLRDATRAEDVVQETLGKLTQRVNHPQGELKPWLYRLTRNACLDILRKQQRSPTHNRPLRTGVDRARTTVGPGTRMVRAERRALIREIIDQMPDDYREVLLLKYFEGLSRVEIAGALAVSEQTVKGRLARASDHLETQLRQYTWTDG